MLVPKLINGCRKRVPVRGLHKMSAQRNSCNLPDIISVHEVRQRFTMLGFSFWYFLKPWRSHIALISTKINQEDPVAEHRQQHHGTNCCVGQWEVRSVHHTIQSDRDGAQVWRISMLPPTALWPCLQNSRNLGLSLLATPL